MQDDLETAVMGIFPDIAQRFGAYRAQQAVQQQQEAAAAAQASGGGGGVEEGEAMVTMVGKAIEGAKEQGEEGREKGEGTVVGGRNAGEGAA